MVKANGRRRFLWKERRRRKSYRHLFFSRWPIRVQLWRLHVLQNNIRSRFLFCARLHSGVEQKHCLGGYIFCSSASPISFSLSLVVPLSCPFNCGVSRKKKEEQKKQGGVQQWQPLSSRGNASLSIQHFACCRGGPLAVGSRRAAVFRSKEPNTIDKGVARHNEFARWVLFFALTFCVVSTLFSDNSGSAVCGEIGLGNDVEVPAVPLRAASVDN